MSTIHEALKRAQKERDGRLTSYGRLMSSRERAAGFTFKGRGFWVVGALMVVLLAFALYSWLDFADPSEATRRPVEQKPPPASPESVKEKPTAQSFVEQGRRYHREGRFREARQCYEKALEADPGDALALNNLGVLQLREDHHAAARRHFEKAIRLKPDYVDPYYNLACLFAIENQPEESLRYLKKAVSLHPSARAWACEDSDLRTLKDLPEFKRTVGLEP